MSKCTKFIRAVEHYVCLTFSTYLITDGPRSGTDPDIREIRGTRIRIRRIREFNIWI